MDTRMESAESVYAELGDVRAAGMEVDIATPGTRSGLADTYVGSFTSLTSITGQEHHGLSLIHI